MKNETTSLRTEPKHEETGTQSEARLRAAAVRMAGNTGRRGAASSWCVAPLPYEKPTSDTGGFAGINREADCLY